MAERIELYSTPEGGEHTKPTDEVKKDAWAQAEALGVKDGARMGYNAKDGSYALILAEGVDEAKVAQLREGTAHYRTDEAKAELAAALPGIKEAAAASRDEKAPAEKAPAAEKAPKEPELPRTSIALFPTPVTVEEGQDAGKAAASAMLKESDKAIDELGLKGVAKNSYDMKAGNWVVGGRGLSDEAVKGLEDKLASFRTPEAESAWRANAPEKPKSAAKGPEEGAEVAAAAAKKGRGAGR